jgi:hypothetical protein
MPTELLELYQQLGQLVWDLFQQGTIETLSTRLADQRSLLEEGWTKNGILELTQSRKTEIRISIAQTLAQIQANPEAPKEPMLLRQLRNKLG